MRIIFNCENITKNYNGEAVVQDINLELNEGGFISLVGHSGVGKTTLFNVLSGVDKPDNGKVFLNNKDITGLSGKVSYMLQKDLLLEYRTVLDNVILPLLITGEKKNTARQKASEYFPMFGLSGYKKKYPNELSGGMRQRAALLRTCLSSNNVILLDEPFSSLDAITRRKIHTWYAGITEQMKISTIFITHDVEEALILSDTVYIMNGKPGKITHKIDVKPQRPRDSGFIVSKEFGEQKLFILKTIN
ncbi:MAG: ABC transporter ATP-binding protein [Treponema sp.]|nr:ABC transporter ATP-binding protein [Treponema sp.]